MNRGTATRDLLTLQGNLPRPISPLAREIANRAAEWASGRDGTKVAQTAPARQSPKPARGPGDVGDQIAALRDQVCDIIAAINASAEAKSARILELAGRVQFSIKGVTPARARAFNREMRGVRDLMMTVAAAECSSEMKSAGLLEVAAKLSRAALAQRLLSVG